MHHQRSLLQVTTLLFAVCFVSIQGLKCWTCDNADTIEECDKNGRLEQCNPSQQVCGIEVRHQGSWATPDKVKVFKYCKQSAACDNVQIQNARAAYKQTQCNPKWPYSVCRCCCLTDGCNVGELKCLPLELTTDCSPALLAPANGAMQCSDGTKRGSVCSFQCDRGYSLVGSMRSTCETEDKESVWSANAPTCRREAVVCPAIPQLRNGGHTCDNGLNVGSMCSFSCDDGYTLVGADVAICQGDSVGRWSTSGQACERKSCSTDLKSPDNGKMSCTNDHFIDSVCTFTCDGNYERVGPKQITCRDGYMYGNPHWDNEVPMCRVQECRSFPQTPARGYMVCSDGKAINSVCEFMCDQEYSPFGATKSTCIRVRGELQWSHDTPTCERRQCPSGPVFPINGQAVCDYGNYVTSVCTFSCAYGYHLVGNKKTTCVDDKGFEVPMWDNETPVCKRKECATSPVAPINGNIVCTKKAYLGSVCEFTCDSSYNRVGFRYSTCMENYETGELEWDNETPECRRGECATGLRAPAHGTIECTNMKALGSVCEFACEEGYRLVGDERSTCMENIESGVAFWNKKTPECVSIACDKMPNAPENGEVLCSNKNMVDSVCTFQCDDEYDLEGHEQSTCSLQKDFYMPMWSHKSPICKRKECDSMPRAPFNGYRSCTDYRNLNSVCTFSCDKGFSLSGKNTTQCVRSNGEQAWDGAVPKCTRDVCPAAVVTPKNGQVTCSEDNSVGSVCVFVCDEGFEMSGPEQTVCMVDYETKMPTWDNKSPRCLLQECQFVPQTPANGFMVCSDGKSANSVCEFMCEDGYRPVGSTRSTCTNVEGMLQWSHAAPTCERRQCESAPRALDNGRAVCDYGSFVSSVCTFACSYGFSLVGSEKTTCVDDKASDKPMWSDETPVCSRKECPAIPSPPINGEVECTEGNFLGSVCGFTCDGSYSRVGFQYTTCIEDFNTGDIKWNNVAPECKRRECTTGLRAPVDGMVDCTDMKALGSICSFTCMGDYQIVGADRSTCVEDTRLGTVEWDNKIPQCVSNACTGTPKAPNNGNVRCSEENLVGSVCTFRCDADYELEGAEQSACSLAEDSYKPMWSHNSPICNRQECDTLPAAPSHGYRSCTDYRSVNSVCTFSCEKGYSMSGPENAKCVKSDAGVVAWDNSAPKCTRKVCPTAVDTPKNGRVTCSDGNAVGSMCSFVCDQGFDMTGPEKSVCMEDYESKMPVWDSASPRCVPKRCSYMPKAPMYGNISCSDKKNYESMCTFSCMDEYMLVGAAETECRYASEEMTGRPKWTEKSPVCERKQCPTIEAPTNGYVICDRKIFAGSKCEYVCNDHHRRMGPADALCQEENGIMKWSNDKPPRCEPLSCPAIQDIPFGEVDCSDEHNVNSECRFTCTGKDYKLSPRRRYSITCQNDTAWSATPPCCARSCPPYAIMDLIVVLDSSSSIGAANWKIMISFVKSIFNLFIVKTDAMNFGVVRYNSEIDLKTQINLNDCPDNITMLKDQVSKIPYDGSGTQTGQALKYVRENMLLPSAGNRPGVPDVVLVITDGRSQDDVTKPAYALRADGVMTFTLGITPKAKSLDMEQLNDIAGSESGIFLARDGFKNLTPEFAEEIMENICGDPCPAAAR